MCIYRWTIRVLLLILLAIKLLHPYLKYVVLLLAARVSNIDYSLVL